MKAFREKTGKVERQLELLASIFTKMPIYGQLFKKEKNLRGVIQSDRSWLCGVKTLWTCFALHCDKNIARFREVNTERISEDDRISSKDFKTKGCCCDL